ncbi:hypothetical protein CDAR_526171 [Caerostris darwini]|uniref:Uncharacterized protein n=1 Tax=Caerostris darwini TaxID=1538125 RepID=A0AAV4UHM5_9ARAC|nr:hypothetical protein CDAR_526171 [Caerostris darwini]
MARAGCSMRKPSCPCPYFIACNEIKRKINNAIKNYYVTQAKGKLWSVLLTNSLPGNLSRNVATATFRLLTSHDYLHGSFIPHWYFPFSLLPSVFRGKLYGF